jgi:hypothetical protein
LITQPVNVYISINCHCYIGRGEGICSSHCAGSKIPMTSGLPQSQWIDKPNWIILDVTIQVSIPTCKANWVLGEPSSRVWILISKSKPYNSGIRIIQPTCKSERNGE